MAQNNRQHAERIKTVDAEKEGLENYIENTGTCMVDITNGKTYLVQYLKGLSDLVGNGYALCAPLRADGTYGAFYVKPYSSFVRKERQAPVRRNASKRIVPNLYQRIRDAESKEGSHMYRQQYQ